MNAITVNHKKMIVVVLGMHRSGTSAITRGLKVIGVDFGTNLQPAMPGVNDKGFFEDNDIVNINEAALFILSHEWHTLSPITREQLKSESLNDVKLSALRLLRVKLESTKVLGIKDPRMPRLLPFWQDIFDELDIDVRYVIAIRNPLSVSKSLKNRDNIEKEKSCYLWLQHILPSVLETAGRRSVVVDYDNMMEQPSFELGRIAKALELNNEISQDELRKYENDFLDVNLCHAKFDINEIINDPDVPKSAISLYRMLAKVATDEWTLEAIEMLKYFQQVALSLNEFTPALNYMTRQDWKISKLKQDVADRDSQIANLKQDVADHDRKIVHFTMLESQLRNEIATIRLSTSWLITKPAREVSRWVRRFMRIIQLHKNYRRKHNGTDGFIRLTTRCIDSIKKGGLKGLFSSIDMHERSLSPFQHSPSAENLILDDISEEKGQLPNDVAVHVHVFYPDLASEIRSYLENIPVEFHCYVTTDTLEKAKLVEVAFFDMKNASTLDIRVVENRGRDLAPMIVELGRELARHEVVLHIHSKRSPHNLDLRGWRRYLMTLLLGNTQRVTAILNQFSKNERLSILYPNIYLPVIPFMRIGGNASHMMTLLGRSGNDSADFSLINQVDFPAGAMFWFRGKAIEPFLKMHLTLQDFDEENGQCDATLAHAIERLFPYFANKNGLEFQSYSSKQLTSSLSGAMPLSLFHEYYSQRMVKNPVIFFDHNIGGGTNLYSREFIDTIITQESSALRIHYTNGNWFVEWIGIDDGMIFVSTAEAELFDTLGKIACKTIIINSLYNYPDIDDAIFRIINLAKLLNATLDYKVHDFYAICPSQHLIDFNEKYCDVPSDHRYCKMCLEKNLAAHWASSRPLAITEWRYSFSRLFRAVDVISTFDQSTIEILRKAFQIDNYNVRITPHRDDYFNTSSFVFSRGNLHIGILGTLTTVKGAKIVNALGNHIKKQNKRIPITVVGQSMVSTISEIRVLGPYENIHLPEIIHREGINVILMPTIVPETFSYTVSEAMKMGLPIVAFDIGAQGRRVKEYAQGKVVPLGSSSEVILSAIQSSLKALELII